MNSDKIIHVIWIDNGEYDFRYHHAFSLLSMVKYLKPSTIKFWTNNPLRVSNNPIYKSIKDVVPLQFMEVDPTTYHGNSVISNPSHVADLYKIHILKTHGGCYSDLDNIFTSNLDHYWDLLEKGIYSAPIEHNYYTKDPEAFCANLIFSPKNHPFLSEWNRGYDFYLPDHYYFNAVTVPFAIYESWIKEPEKFKLLNGVYGDSWSGNHCEEFDLYKLYAGDHLDSDFKDVKVFHLWESQAKRWLHKQDLNYLKSVRTTYTKLIKSYLEIVSSSTHYE